MNATILLGILATVLLLVSAAYGVRRRMMRFFTRVGLGRARTWLRLHIACGLLFLVALGFHAGFDLPGGLLNRALWLLALWTVASGFLGLAVQRTVPRILSAIGVGGGQLRPHPRAGGRDPPAGREPVGRVGRRRCATSTAQPGAHARAPQRNLSVLLDAGGRRRTWIRWTAAVAAARDQRARLAQLEALVRTKLDLDIHYTLQQVLRGWLWLHVPTSALLAGARRVHVVAMLAYYQPMSGRFQRTRKAARTGQRSAARTCRCRSDIWCLAPAARCCLAGLAAGLVALLLVWLDVEHDGGDWLSGGPLSSAHASLDMGCASCHGEAFGTLLGGVADTGCTECHEGAECGLRRSPAGALQRRIPRGAAHCRGRAQNARRRAVLRLVPRRARGARRIAGGRRRPAVPRLPSKATASTAIIPSSPLSRRSRRTTTRFTSPTASTSRKC